MTIANPMVGMLPYTVSTVLSDKTIVSWKIPTEPLSRTRRLKALHAGRCAASFIFEYASSFSNDSQYCHTRIVFPDRYVLGFPTSPRSRFFCSSTNIRGIATNTGSHFHTCQMRLKRIPIRKRTFPSAPASAVKRPLFTFDIMATVLAAQNYGISSESLCLRCPNVESVVSHLSRMPTIS